VGYFAKAATKAQATVLTSDWANSVQEEIVGVILAAGLTLNKADNTQLSAAIGSIASLGIVGQSSGTFQATTVWDRGVVLCYDGGSGGPVIGGQGNFAIGSGGGSAASGGTQNALIATLSGNISADQCLIACCSGTAGSVLSGDQSGIIGSSAGTSIRSNAERAWIIGSNGVKIGDSAPSFNVLAAASLNASIDGNRTFLAAAVGGTSAGTDVELDGASSAIVAATGSAANPTRIQSSATDSAILASTGGIISSGRSNAIVASGFTTSGDYPFISSTGQNCAVIAAGAGGIQGVGAICSAIVAAGLSLSGQRATVEGAFSAVVASSGNTDIASTALNAAIIASRNDSGVNSIDLSGECSALVGVDGPAVVSGDNSAIVCSDTVGTTGPTLAADNILAGAAGTSLTWQLDSATGRATVGALTHNDNSTASAGITPSLSALPSGAAATIKWFKVSDGVDDYWIPAWRTT
jgi:hypothetical protein